MTYRKFLTACLLIVAWTAPLQAAAKGFLAVVTDDLERSVAWYSDVFDMDTIKSIDEDAYAIRVLEGEALIIEIIAQDQAPPRPVGRFSGITKSGAVITNFDSSVARWKSNGIEFFGHGQTFRDDDMGRASTIVVDPDGNRIQVFGPKEASRPEAALIDLSPRLVAVSVSNLDTTLDWYADVLGFALVERHAFPDDQMQVAFMERDGFEIELIEIAETPGFDAPEPGNPATRQGWSKIAFETDGIEDLFRLATEADATVLNTLRDSRRTGGRFFILQDPDGNWVQVFSR